MKTAISIPDDLFREAENLAAKTGMSRSRLYALALRRYLDQVKDRGVTPELDRVYSDCPEHDRAAEHAALADLERDGG